MTVDQHKSWERTVFKIHSEMRDKDGLNPIEAASEISNLLILKIIIENLEIPHKGLSPAKIRELFYQEIGKISPLLTYQISLSDSCLESVWDILCSLTIANADTDLVGGVIQKTVSPNSRSGMGQYFTPAELIKFMVKIIDPTRNCLVIDPFHGSAEFLIEASNHIDENGVLESTNFYGIEKNPLIHKISVLKNMLCTSQLNLILGDGFSETMNLPNGGLESFDIVITNPPFGSKIQTKEITNPEQYTIIQDRKSINTETLAVERCLNYLKDGGKFGIVVPDSFLGNKNHNKIRNLLSERLDFRAIISLPIETFTPFGANVKSSIIFGKKHDKKNLPSEKTLMIQINQIGYDSRGRKTNQNDLNSALLTIGDSLWK